LTFPLGPKNFNISLKSKITKFLNKAWDKVLVPGQVADAVAASNDGSYAAAATYDGSDAGNDGGATADSAAATGCN
jgi:hypothetical protein